jgi:hypothetical protein
MKPLKQFNTYSSKNNFFKINIGNKILKKFPNLVNHYLIWLFRSTLPLSSKLMLIESTQTEVAILEALLILKNHYKTEDIPNRNKENQEHFNSS